LAIWTGDVICNLTGYQAIARASKNDRATIGISLLGLVAAPNIKRAVSLSPSFALYLIVQKL